MELEKGKLVFRRANIDDVPALVNYRVRFLNELLNHPEDAKTQALRRSLMEYFSRAVPSGNFIAWVVEHDGIIIATSGMVLWQKPGIYGGAESGRLGYILNFYTIPEARGRGIATRLLDELLREARSLGLKYVHLHASKDGIGIYRRAGFTEPKIPELELELDLDSNEKQLWGNAFLTIVYSIPTVPYLNNDSEI